MHEVYKVIILHICVIIVGATDGHYVCGSSMSGLLGLFFISHPASQVYNNYIHHDSILYQDYDSR